MSGKAFALWLAVICIVVQIPPLFMGVELCDSGFYLTFYNNIYSHPECVEYNFMYYLSGLTGGALLKIMHTALGMRIVGAAVNVLCALCLAAAFPARRFRSAVAGSSLLMIVGSWWLPLTFSYDHLTSLLTCVGLLLIMRSVTARNRTGAVCLALASGLVLGMNTFARIPNVLGFAYILLIPIGRCHLPPETHVAICSRIFCSRMDCRSGTCPGCHAGTQPFQHFRQQHVRPVRDSLVSRRRGLTRNQPPDPCPD